MYVRDLGDPVALSGPPARVVINVIRNKHVPRFEGLLNYRKNITANQQVNSVIFTVTANDQDNKVKILFYTIEYMYVHFCTSNIF